MIQRIQTIYLLIVAGISAGLIFLFNLWVTIEELVVFAKDEIVYFSMFMASAILALIAIFMFKNRKFQFVLGRLNIILNFILLGLFVYRSLSISGETSDVSEKGIGILLPIFSIVFLVLANKAIKKDEDLVKSVDRLR
jgi:membrane protease YdiL (CAAX protease family)